MKQYIKKITLRVHSFGMWILAYTKMTPARMFLSKVSLLTLGFIIMSTHSYSSPIPPQEVISPKHKIKALLIQSTHVPMISMSYTFLGGAAYDPKDKSGLTQFVTALLDEGAGDMDAEAFHKKLESAAIKMSFSADRDRIGGSLQVINEHRGAGFDLLKLALTKPRFDPVPFERIRKQMIVAIERKKEEPDDQASEKLGLIVFGDHPYGIPQSGTIESVKSITREDCLKLTKDRFARKDLIVSVAGDITPVELGQRLDKLFGDFPETPQIVPLADVQLNLSGKTEIIKLNDRPQTVAVFAHQGVTRNDPDFYAAYILNQIVGGHAFSARLMDEVRTKRGLTYGIGTQMIWNDKSAYTVGSSSTDNKSFNESLKIIRDVYRKIAEDGPTEEEVKATKDFMTGSFPLMMDSTAKLAQLLTQMQKDNLPLDFLKTRNDKIRAVTLEQIKAVAKRLFAEDKLTTVAAGNPV